LCRYKHPFRMHIISYFTSFNMLHGSNSFLHLSSWQLTFNVISSLPTGNNEHLMFFRFETVTVTFIEIVMLPVACFCTHLCWYAEDDFST